MRAISVYAISEASGNETQGLCGFSLLCNAFALLFPGPPYLCLTSISFLLKSSESLQIPVFDGQ